jgi:hypothetical protein
LGCWFLDCRLEKSVLWVPDAESGQSIAKLFGAQLKAVLPDLVIRVETFQAEKPKPQASILNKAGRKWLAQQQKLSESE